MAITDALQRVEDALEVLKARAHRRLQHLAAKIGRKRDYITRITETERYSFVRLLEVIDAYEEQPGRFFARAFDISPDPDRYLEELVRPGEVEPAFGRIERVTRRLEHQPPPAGKPSTSRAAVADLTRSCRSDQRKRLRAAHKFHTVPFLRCYLVHLDDLRYESPADAAYLGETVAADVVAQVIATRAERLDLQCRALGVYGSAHRLLGNYSTAAKAILLGLEVARRHDLDLTVADLLQRGAYVLHDQTQYDRALRLLMEAQIIYSDLGLLAEKGRVLVDRGIMLGQQAKYEKSKAVFERALEILPEYEARNRLSASHGIAVAYYELGQLDAAEKWLDEVLSRGQQHGGAIVAKMIWLQGLILGKRNNHAAASLILYKAFKMLSARETPLAVAMVSLDLISSLLKEGKRDQALNVVRNMTMLIVQFRGNRVAEGALIELTEAGLYGRIDEELIDQTAKKLKTAHRQPGAPSPCISR